MINAQQNESFYKNLAQAMSRCLLSKSGEEEKLKFLKNLKSELQPEHFSFVMNEYKNSMRDSSLSYSLLKENQLALLDFFHEENIESPDKTLSIFLQFWPKTKDFLFEYYEKRPQKNLTIKSLIIVLEKEEFSEEEQNDVLELIKKRVDLEKTETLLTYEIKSYIEGEHFKYKYDKQKKFVLALTDLISQLEPNTLNAEVFEIYYQSNCGLEKQTKYHLLNKAKSYHEKIYLRLDEIIEYMPIENIAKNLKEYAKKYPSAEKFLLDVLNSRFGRDEKLLEKEKLAIEWLKTSVRELDINTNWPYSWITRLIGYQNTNEVLKKQCVETILTHLTPERSEFIERFIFDRNGYSSEKKEEKLIFQYYANYFTQNDFTLPLYTQFILKNSFPHLENDIVVFFEKQELNKIIQPHKEMAPEQKEKIKYKL